MKRASLAAVLVALMACNALAANPPAHPADELYDKAMQLYGQRKFVEALPLAQQLVGHDEKALGPDHLDFAKELNLLGLLYHELRHSADAETCYKRSLAIREKQLWPDHPDIAQSVNNLGLLYIAEGHYADAEPLLKRALAIRVKTFKQDRSSRLEWRACLVLRKDWVQGPDPFSRTRCNAKRCTADPGSFHAQNV